MDHINSQKSRQAGYAAKNRQKSKTIGRPDGRAVADAYMAAVEDGHLEQLMRIYIKMLAPDADPDVGSYQIKAVIRSLARAILCDRGYDDEQIKDKMRSMQAD